ncbi:MAG: hypothetical protein HC906_13705 [Bacteroidales bacterium]|nr:hypothetical protein [Bacteroidales bacterium]
MPFGRDFLLLLAGLLLIDFLGLVFLVEEAATTDSFEISKLYVLHLPILSKEGAIIKTGYESLPLTLIPIITYQNG